MKLYIKEPHPGPRLYISEDLIKSDEKSEKDDDDLFLDIDAVDKAYKEGPQLITMTDKIKDPEVRGL